MIQKKEASDDSSDEEDKENTYKPPQIAESLHIVDMKAFLMK
jgi:hypothetical protein